MTEADQAVRRLGSSTAGPTAEAVTPTAAGTAVAPTPTLQPGDATPPAATGRRFEVLYFAVRNVKLLIGLGIVTTCLLIALIGPSFTDLSPFAFGGPVHQAPSHAHWLGTTEQGQDVYTQFVHGMRSSFLVGALGGGLAALFGMLVGFTGGYRGGFVDEILNMFTNVVIVIPALAVLIVVGSLLTIKGYVPEAILIGCLQWPWAARAVRAQTFSLVARDFIDVARLSGKRTGRIIATEIAPNMSSYLLMMFILLFGGAILIGATLDFIGLGPSNAMSLGLMMNYAVSWSALQLGTWWWFIPPGVGIMAIVGGLYIMNVGLDEVFNPKLREL